MKKPNSASAKLPSCVQPERDRVEEDDLDVEDDEEHRRQVEADREALLFRRADRDTRLEGDRLLAGLVFGRVARMNEAAISEAGIAKAKKP